MIWSEISVADQAVIVDFVSEPANGIPASKILKPFVNSDCIRELSPLALDSSRVSVRRKQATLRVYLDSGVASAKDTKSAPLLELLNSCAVRPKHHTWDIRKVWLVQNQYRLPVSTFRRLPARRESPQSDVTRCLGPVLQIRHAANCPVPAEATAPAMVGNLRNSSIGNCRAGLTPSPSCLRTA